MKVTLYKAADGGLHTSYKEFAQRQIELRILPAAQKLVDTSLPVDGLNPSDAAQWIAKNGDALRKLLNDAQTAKRVRKATKAKPTTVAEEILESAAS